MSATNNCPMCDQPEDATALLARRVQEMCANQLTLGGLLTEAMVIIGAASGSPASVAWFFKVDEYLAKQGVKPSGVRA